MWDSGESGRAKKPRSGPRDAIEAEVSDPMAIVRREDQEDDDKPWLQSWQKDSSGMVYQKSCEFLRWEEKKLQERTRHQNAGGHRPGRIHQNLARYECRAPESAPSWRPMQQERVQAHCNLKPVLDHANADNAPIIVGKGDCQQATQENGECLGQPGASHRRGEVEVPSCTSRAPWPIRCKSGKERRALVCPGNDQ